MKNKFLLGSLFGVATAMVIGLATTPTTKLETIAPLKQQQKTSDVIYFEDFEDDVMAKEGWKTGFDIVDGTAVNNGGGWVDVPLAENERTADNNYEVSFDLKYDSSESSEVRISST